MTQSMSVKPSLPLHMAGMFGRRGAGGGGGGFKERLQVNRPLQLALNSGVQSQRALGNSRHQITDQQGI